nr:reverse transcriptase domain-containing protein [Tanacetum cinerariifolium]
MSHTSSAVTYTSVYTNFEPGRVFWGADEELSEGGSLWVIVYGYDGLPMLPVAPPSPDYILGPEEPQTPPAPQYEDTHEPMFIQPHDPDFMPEPIYPKYIPLKEEHILSAEEQLLPPVVSPTAESPGYVANGGDDDDGDSSGYDADDEDEDEEEEGKEHLAPADSVVVIPTDELVSPPEGTYPIIPPPSTDTTTIRARITIRPDDILESEQPPRKRLCLSTLGFRYEIGESSTRGRGVDYGFADTVEAEMRHRELAELHEHDTQDLYALLEDAQDDRTRISQWVAMDSQRVDLLMRDMMTLQVIVWIMKEEAYTAREAWAHSIGLSKTVHHELQTLHSRDVLTNERNETRDRRHADRVVSTMSTAEESWTARGDARGEVKKLDIKLWNLKVKGNDVPTYTNRFQELTLICIKFVANENEKFDKYISGLTDSIYGNVRSSKPRTLDKTTELTNDLMDQKLRTYAERSNSASLETRLCFVSRRCCVLPKKNSCVLLKDTRPPMLDRTDFASWQQRIRLYCRGKDNGVNILKSIDEGPYKLGTFRETLAESIEGTPQFGPERPRVYSDLNSEESDWYNADIRATNILLQGLPKDIYTLINHYNDTKDIWDNVKMLLEGSELTKEDKESQASVQDRRVVVQNVQGRPNRGQGMNPWGGNAARYGEAQNIVGNVNQGQVRLGQARTVKCYNCNGGPDNAFDDDVDEQPV